MVKPPWPTMPAGKVEKKKFCRGVCYSVTGFDIGSDGLGRLDLA